VGIFVAPEDHDQLASAILTLADDKIRRQKMGSHATSLIEEKFDPESISDAVEMVYVEVMQK
jgi:glycosyltransferase involved in cell wall biosynthesis